MSPRGRESSEAAFQTASLGQVSSLQNYNRKGKSTKHSHEETIAQRLIYINLQRNQDDV